MPDAIALLLATTVATAVFHTLIPDHWLPFVLIGRARRWNAGRTVAVSGLSALVHAALSVALGLAALAVGSGAASIVGERLERASGLLLVGFGVAYAAWAWKKGGHFHPGGASVHARAHDEQACDGAEGPANPEHLHYHADEALISGGEGKGAYWLAMIVGLNPCVLVLPLFVKTAELGTQPLVLVTAAYVVTTVALMVGLSVVGVATALRIPVPAAARHMETASGLVIAVVGVVFLVWGR